MAERKLSEFMETMREYRDMFNDTFPTEMVTFSEKKMIAIMRDCIERGEPYEVPGYDPTLVY